MYDTYGFHVTSRRLYVRRAPEKGYITPLFGEEYFMTDRAVLTKATTQ